MAEYNIDYIEPENERDNPHDVGLEELDAIIYSGKPPALPTVTWEGLTASQQNAMLMANKSPFFPFTLPEIMACEWLAENGLLSDLDGEYMLTEAGRALLPKAGEAVSVPTAKAIPPHATLLQDLQSIAMGEIEDCPVANIAMSAHNLINTLEHELTAANERAEAAEAEVARLRDGLRLVARFFTEDAEKPSDEVINNNWYALPPETQKIANQNYDFGLSLGRWEAAQCAYEVLNLKSK